MAVDYSNPYVQEIYQRRAQRNAMLQEMQEEMLRQQAAAQAEALQAEQAQEANRQQRLQALSFYDPQYPEAPKEEPGFFKQVAQRAVPQTLGMFAGGGALLSDLMGADTARDYLMEKQQELENYAQKNAPRSEPELGATEFDPSRMGTWAKETLADVVPTIGAAVGSALTGGLAAPALAGGIVRGGLSTAGKAAARKYGAAAGLYGSTGVMEGGGAYATDYQAHGAEGTSPWMDLGVGVANAAVEKFAPTGRILNKITGVPVSAATEEVARRTIGAGFGKFMAAGAKGAGREGMTEAIQETTNVLNENIQDDKALLSTGDVARLFESFAAGALTGGPGGVVEHYSKPRGQGAQSSIPGMPITDPETYVDPMSAPREGAMPMRKAPGIVDDKWVGAIDSTLNDITGYTESSNKTIEDMQTTYDSTLGDLEAQYSEASRGYYSAQTKPADGADPMLQAEEKKQYGAAARKLAAQITKTKIERDKEISAAKKTQKETLAKMQNRLDKDFGIQSSVLKEYGPDAVRASVKSIQDSNTYATRVQTALQEKIAELNESATIMKKTLLDPKIAVEDSSALLDQLRATQLEKKKTAKELASVRKIANRFRTSLQENKLNNPAEIEALRTQLLTATDIAPAEFDKSMDNFLEEAQAPMPENMVEQAYAQPAQMVQPPMVDPVGAAPFDEVPTAPVPTEEQFSAPPPAPFGGMSDELMGMAPRDAQVMPEQSLEGLPSPATPSTSYAMPAAARSAYAMLPQGQPPQQSIATITKDLAPTMRQLPALKGNVLVCYDHTDARLPEEVRVNPEMGKNFGAYLPDGRVVLFSKNLEDTAQAVVARDTKKDLNKVRKELAVKKLVHEAVIHRGLRVLFNDRELNRFLTLVDSSFRGTALWNRLMPDSPRTTPAQNLTDAEEFVAKLAERQKVKSMLTSQDKTFWSKIKTFTKLLLKKLGLTSISEDDLQLVIRGAASSLADPLNVNTLRATSDRILNSTIEGTEVSPRVQEAQRQLDRKFTDKALGFFSEAGINPAKLKETILDADEPIQRHIRALNKKYPHRLTAFTNIYRNKERLPNQIATALGKAKTDFVDPLLVAIDDTRKGRQEDGAITFARAEDYLVALAARERNQYVPSGMSTEVADKIINEYQSPEMDRLAGVMKAIHQERLRILRESNLVPKEMLDAWESKYQYYMPLKAWEDAVQILDPVWFSSSSRKSLSVPTAQEKISRRAMGSDSVPTSPISHGIMQLYDVIQLEKKVTVGRQLLQLVKDFPDATDTFEIVQELDMKSATPEEKQDFRTKTGLKQVIDPEKGLRLKPRKTIVEGKGDEAVTVIADDGSLVRIWIKPDDFRRALKGENIVQAGPVLQSIGAIQRGMGKLFTSRNPLFWFTNPLRDALTASLNMTQVAYELKAQGVPSPQSLAVDILTKGIGTTFSTQGVRAALMEYYKKGAINLSNYSPEARDMLQHLDAFREYGGQSSFFSQSNVELLEKDLVEAVRMKNPNSRPQLIKSILTRTFEHMDNISDSLENMTRYVAFASVVDALNKHGVITNADGTKTKMSEQPFEVYARAASIALNLTVNFSRKGSWAPAFNSLYLFASASIGGSARMLRTLFPVNKETGKYDFKRTAMFFTLPAIGYAVLSTLCRALMPDDEDGINTYDKIPSHIKDSNFIIPNPFGKGDYIKIPIAYGFNTLWALARGLTDKVYLTAVGQPAPSGVKTVTNAFATMFDNFSPLGKPEEGWSMFVPTVFRPIVQLSTNTNFAGNPIYPESTHLVRGELPDSQKYWSTTNDGVKWLAEFMNSVTGGSTTRKGFIDVSPESIEHVITAYTGGIGRIATMMGARSVELAQGKPVDTTQLPFVSLFYKTPQNSDTSAIFVRLRQEVQTQVNTVDSMFKQPGLPPEERAAVLRDNKQGSQLRGYTNSINTRLNDIRHQQRKIEQSDAAAATKYEKIKALDDKRVALMKQYNKRAIAVGVEGAL